MKMNKVVLGFAVIFASGSMLKGIDLSDLRDAIKNRDIAKVKELAAEVSNKTALNGLLNEILDDVEISENIIQALLEEGADADRSTLRRMLDRGSLNSVAGLIEKMTTDELNEENAEGQTAAEQIEAVVSSRVIAPLAKKGIVLTPGKEVRIEQGKKIDEASQKYKASGGRQRALRTTAAGEGRSVFKKPAAHTRTPTRRVSN